MPVESKPRHHPEFLRFLVFNFLKVVYLFIRLFVCLFMYLAAHTYGSFRYGTLSPKRLLQLAQKNGVRKLVVADINSTAGCLEVKRQSRSIDVEVAFGVDFRNGNKRCFVAIAKNNRGFQEINDFLSIHLHNGEEIPDKAPDFEHVWVVYPWQHITSPHTLRAWERVGIPPQDLNKLPFSHWRNRLDKLVIDQTVTFARIKERGIHKLLRAIDLNTLLDKVPESELAGEYEIMVPEERLEEIYAAYPAIVKQTRALMNACHIHFDYNLDGKHENQQFYTHNADLDFRLLQKLCLQGLSYRYPDCDDHIRERVRKELEVIRKKGFVCYFLIAWKIVKYARQQGYFYVGRGSGANSIVSYLLRITDVDPIALNLYFERFINLFRKNPPDFDIDFSWKDREDVTHYIFKQFPNVALLGSYNTFNYKSVIRELGKVYGLPEFEIRQLQDQGEPSDAVGEKIVENARFIEGFPNYLSIHSGGILISERPIHWFTATALPPKGLPLTHFDMHIAEDVGLYKFDILGHRGLAKVKDALVMIRENRRETPDLHRMNALMADPASNDLLKKGTAIGCFYVESPAMRMLLQKLRVSDYLGLVAASSVIRPGVAQSGMMREYILRFRDHKRRHEARKRMPQLYDIMPETFGVMVYQEDVIKVAHFFAGLSLSEADVLRRGMSGKFRSREEFARARSRFFANCRERGYNDALVADVWRQIESFAGYAFAKGHSASYAVESYQCLYLKAHYPLEFMVATVNNGGGFYSREIYLREAMMHGAKVELPCVNHSSGEAVLNDNVIYLGLDMVNGVEKKWIREVLKWRERDGGYRDLPDFIARTGLPLEQLEKLIRIQAFRFTGKPKKNLLWEAYMMAGTQRQPRAREQTLFPPQNVEWKVPEFPTRDLQHAWDELELLGFTLRNPFGLLKTPPRNPLVAADLKHYVGRDIEIPGYLVHLKRSTTKNGQRMGFATFIDWYGQWLDAVVFPPVMARYPFRGPGCYRLFGKVTVEFEYLSIELKRLEYMAMLSADDMEGASESVWPANEWAVRKG